MRPLDVVPSGRVHGGRAGALEVAVGHVMGLGESRTVAMERFNNFCCRDLRGAVLVNLRLCECTPHSHRAGQGATLPGANDEEQEQSWAHEGWCQRIKDVARCDTAKRAPRAEAPAAYPPLRLLLVVLSIASVLCQPPARVLEEFSFRARPSTVCTDASLFIPLFRMSRHLSLTSCLSFRRDQPIHRPAPARQLGPRRQRGRAPPFVCGSRRRRRPPRGGSRRSSHSR